MKYCTKCGALHQDEAQFCFKCGLSFATPKESQAEQQDIVTTKNTDKIDSKIKPIQCPYCKSKELAFLPYEDKQKPYGGLFYTILGIVSVIFFILFLIIIPETPTLIELINNPIGIFFLIIIISIFFLIGLRIKQPYKSYQRIQFICKHCGNHGILYSEKDNARYDIDYLRK